MWLLISAIAGLVTTQFWLREPAGKYRLGQLAMVFWALTAMIFVDHVIGWWLDGAEGDFMDISLDAFVLSLCMIIPILMIWQILLIMDRYGIRLGRKNEENSDSKVSKEVD
jgi:hypothetical protein